MGKAVACLLLPLSLFLLLLRLFPRFFLLALYASSEEDTDGFLARSYRLIRGSNKVSVGFSEEETIPCTV